jgi:hypothetical protein
MNEPQDLPVIFAVTGHRDIRREDEPALTTAVLGLFERFRKRYPSTPIVLLTPLASGADRLVARVAVTLRIPFRVPMPFDEAEYRKDFDASEDAEFSELLALAGDRYVLPFAPGNTADNVGERAHRALQYAAAGAHLTRTAHVMLAIWNGKASEGVGGTADIVQYRLYGAPAELRGPTALLDAPDTGPIYHIVAARRSDPETEWPVGTVFVRTARGQVGELGDPSRQLYERIERFNQDQLRLGPPSAGSAGSLRLRDIAERLATHYQSRYRRALDIMFVATTAGAISLALGHHDAPKYAAVLFYCTIVTVAFLVYVVAERQRWKDRSIEYRSLELGLTIQRVWDLVGLQASVADFYLRIQRSEFDWIREAVRTVYNLTPGSAVDTKLGVVAVYDFVVSQRDFFFAATPRDARMFDRFKLVGDTLFAVGGVLTAILFVVAIANSWSFAPPANVVPWFGSVWGHGDVIIRAIAIVTILAAVLHEYPNRRAFHAQARRYAIMLQIYDRALDRLEAAHEAPFDERLRVAREVIREVGKEALAENGEWLMMHRELPIDPLRV